VNSEKQSVIASLESFVQTKLNLLGPVEKVWQPTDFLPDLSSEDWLHELNQLRDAAKGLNDELLVVLVGSMVTEEALPSYQTFLNRFNGVGDETGACQNPWALWSRGWTAEENRHGDLLNRYMYLSGRVNMHAVEVTIQHLIRNGFNPGTCNDPYNGLVYTSFQERATRISHTRVGQFAKQSGDTALSKMCNVIAGDEARHEEAYKCFMKYVFEKDPSGAVLSFDEMLKQRIVMPASLMSDGSEQDIFTTFSTVAQRIGVYTFLDYVDILEHLISTWNVAELKGLSGEAAKAQDRICTLPGRYRKTMERIDSKLRAQPKVPFRWIHDRSV
jgi:acyl-[acyl-carrier-protein] desaturase